MSKDLHSPQKTSKEDYTTQPAARQSQSVISPTTEGKEKETTKKQQTSRSMIYKYIYIYTHLAAI